MKYRRKLQQSQLADDTSEYLDNQFVQFLQRSNLLNKNRLESHNSIFLPVHHQGKIQRVAELQSRRTPLHSFVHRVHAPAYAELKGKLKIYP